MVSERYAINIEYIPGLLRLLKQTLVARRKLCKSFKLESPFGSSKDKRIYEE